MGKFVRKWYLLLRLRRKSLRGAAEAESITQIVNGLLWVEKSRFLGDVAKYRFFFFPRSVRSQNKRVAKDMARLDECLSEIPSLIVQSTASLSGLDQIIPELKGNESFIRITGHGDEFSDWTNFFFVHLPAKYKWLGPASLGVWALIWVYLILPKYPFICSHMYFLSSIKAC